MPNLNFVGKSKVVNHHRDVSFRFLERQYGLSENMIIHGDNLLALRSLLATHRGKIKCIYIDPPYNTGNENWIYNDNVNDPEIRSWIGKVVGDEETDLNRHDKWLCMMYPRLRLLHELLSDDGAIFISIDDNEVANLKLICNEIFGINNFIVMFTWRRRSGANDALNNVSLDHEYVVCYSKSKKFSMNGVTKNFEKYSNPDNDPRGAWVRGDLTCGKTADQRPNLFYPITDPKTGITYQCNPDHVWRFERNRMQQLIETGKVLFPADGNGRPAYKRHQAEVRSETKPFSSIIETKLNSAATRELRDIFGKQVFDYPKTVDLIRQIVYQSTDPDSIVLDAFAGSGTTAQSVIELNREDHGNRKFILIELMDYCESITAERVRRINGDFSFYELGDPIFIEDEINPDLSRDLFRRYLYFSETKKEIPPMNPDEPTLLGINDGIAYHLIDGDLNFNSLAQIKTRSNSYVIYAESCTISQETRDQFKIIFRKIPRDVRRI